MVQRLTSRCLASSRWLTPFDRSARMYSRCRSFRPRPPAREPPLGPRLRLPRDRALPDRVPPPLAEGEHHRELELAGGRGRIKILGQRPELHSRPVQALDHLQPVGQPLESRSMWVTTRVGLFFGPSCTMSLL